MELRALVLAAAGPLARIEGGLDTPLAERLVGLIGIATMIGIAYLISWDRKHVNWRLVASGLLLQSAFGVLVLRTRPGRWFFATCGDLVNLLSYSAAGARIVFGKLTGSTVPVGVPAGAGVDASGNIFVGQTEAPLLIRPFVEKMTPSELHTVMTGGFATVAGGVLAVYVLLAINVAAMLMAFFGLIALLNALLGWAGGLVGLDGLSIELVLGQIARPLAWTLGVPWQDTAYVGSLLGIKTVLTEFVAYTNLGSQLASGAVHLEPRSVIIASYALLGFANLPSIAIQIGGISGLAPSRRGELARLGLRAMIAGNLAALMSASIAGMLA
jgi:CNT family concentrative nucleoside transporter